MTTSFHIWKQVVNMQPGGARGRSGTAEWNPGKFGAELMRARKDVPIALIATIIGMTTVGRTS